jgi:TolA-binding protein
LLESYIKELQDQIDADRRELEELERNPENDSARADLLRLRIEGMNREAERLRKALQNTERECQIRDL